MDNASYAIKEIAYGTARSNDRRGVLIKIKKYWILPSIAGFFRLHEKR